MADSTTVDPVQQALDQCEAKVIEGALPAAFTVEALRYLRGAVDRNFQKHINWWNRDKPEVLRMAWHLGALARLIASIRNEAPIGSESANRAGAIVSQNCKLGQGEVGALGEYCAGSFPPII